MTQKVSRFKVGIFVILGLLMTLAGIVYLGASRYLQDADTYVTFFNESVQGLAKDSVVKYLGVSVGKISDIRVAPDYNLIEVVIKVDFAVDLSKEMVAQLKTVGITGITFVELTRRDPGEPDLSPKITFPTEYPVIPSKPSEVARILSVVDRLAGQMQKVDLAALAQRLQEVLDASHALVGGDKVKAILAKVDSAAARLDNIMARTEAKLAALDLEGVMGEAKEVMAEGRRAAKQGGLLLAEGRQTVAAIRQQIIEMDLPGAARKTESLLSGLDAGSRDLMGELREASQTLTKASQNLEQLLQRLEQSPSQLLFSSPPPPRQID
ncbi:MAG: MlaD family protein [Desulfarculaceae bacterium]|jgi:phospholipid/cholesterol/gamma-HCH transport system substrate-binding protein